MIGCLWTRVRKQPIIALYFESENELKFYNLETRFHLPFQLIRLRLLISSETIREVAVFVDPTVGQYEFRELILTDPRLGQQKSHN